MPFVGRRQETQAILRRLGADEHAFRAARGVCPAHVPLLEGLGDPLGVAVLYLDVLDHADLRRAEGGVGAGAACVACASMGRIEARLLATLATHCSDAEVQARMDGGPGLCWQHLTLVTAQMEADPAAALRRRHDERRRALADDLRQRVHHLGGESVDAGLAASLRPALAHAIACCAGGRGPRPRHVPCDREGGTP